MRKLSALFLPILACLATPAMAQAIVYEQVFTYEVVEEVVEEADDLSPEQVATWQAQGGERFVQTLAEPQAAPIPRGIAAFGPFRVLDEGRAALVDVTDAKSPAAFAAMLRAYPGIAELELVDCPGTYDDHANLRLGRMIRAAGLATHVPANGSVRSGAVELFLAGATRRIDDGAEFAVHAWQDEDGHQASDYAASDPDNAKYIAYYREMGMAAQEARAFYAMTNSAPFESALWLDAAQMRGWVRSDGMPARAAYAIRFAGLDSGPLLK